MMIQLKPLKVKIQRKVCKIKNKLTKEEYSKIYPTGSCPGKMYGTLKTHKLSKTGTVKNFSSRPINSNVGTKPCHTAKYLAKLLSLPDYSKCTVKNIKDIIHHNKTSYLLHVVIN